VQKKTGLSIGDLAWSNPGEIGWLNSSWKY